MSTPITTRVDFQQLAEARLVEAKALLDAGKWDGAYYLAGYAVEIALKACIIKLLMATDAFPDKRFTERCYTHDIGELVGLAGLRSAWDAARTTDATLSASWAIIKEWSEQKRYHRISEAEARLVRCHFRGGSWDADMDQDAMVITKFDGGRRLIDALVARGLDIRAAFWAKPSEERWRLFLASPAVDAQGARFVYGLINSTIRDAPELGIDPFDVTALGAEDSMARAAADFAARRTARAPRSLGGVVPFDDSRLGRQYVEGAFIYPLRLPDAADPV